MRSVVMTREILMQSCENIEKVFKAENIELKRDSWLGKSIEIIKRIENKQTSFDPRSLKAHRIMSVIVMLGEDLLECKNKNISLREKLNKFCKVKNSDSRLHEITVLACLLRNNYLAEFIKEESDKETPDIKMISREGAIECKIAGNFERIIERIHKAHTQLKNYPGIKIVDIFIYFSVTKNEITKLGEAVFERVKNKMLSRMNITGLHAVNLRFLESRVLEGGRISTTFNLFFKYNEDLSNVREILFAFDDH
jgi:hypothetical protein